MQCELGEVFEQAVKVIELAICISMKSGSNELIRLAQENQIIIDRVKMIDIGIFRLDDRTSRSDRQIIADLFDAASSQLDWMLDGFDKESQADEMEQTKALAISFAILVIIAEPENTTRTKYYKEKYPSLSIMLKAFKL